MSTQHIITCILLSSLVMLTTVELLVAYINLQMYMYLYLSGICIVYLQVTVQIYSVSLPDRPKRLT